MKKISLYLFTLAIIISTFYSCKAKKFNYITYYNEALAIDSVLRFNKDTLATIKSYKKLFKKYGPQNQKRLREFETYIMLSHKHNKNFGGKKSLYKLIDLIAPRKAWYTNYSFFKKYGIDSLEVLERIKKREEKYNTVLADSFNIGYYRDQRSRKYGWSDTTKINDLKNVALFKWALKNHGFPSPAKIGNLKEVYLSDLYSVMLNHFSSCKDYPFFEKELLKYVKSGECNPYSYAKMVDIHHTEHLDSTKNPYRIHIGFYETMPIDSARINKNRKTIGLPSLKHSKLIQSDKVQILKIK